MSDPVVTLPGQGRRITILGMGPSANERRHDIERYCEGTEIWGLNNGYLKYPQLRGTWGRFFELHSWKYLRKWESGVDDHFAAIAALKCPVFVGQPLPLIEDQTVFPFLDVCRHFDSNYFLGSPSLMLMLALYEHDNGNPVEEVRSWGIDTSDPSHGQQRSAWSWWLAHAHNREIKLTGTSTQFMAEHENDDGLRGLREELGATILEEEKQQQEERE